MRDATLERVEGRLSLMHLGGGDPSENSPVTSSTSDEGDIKRYLNV